MRDYVEKLIDSGEMRIVAREVDPRFELAAVTHAAQTAGEAALLFRKVRGGDLPVATNLYGSHSRLCRLIGAEDDNFCARWLALTDAFEAAPAAPATEAALNPGVVTVPFSDLPQITWHEKDAAPYITAGIVIAYHPDTGVPNLSFHRAMHVSETELRIRIGASHDLSIYMAAAEARGQALEIAMLVGAAPEIFLAACASLPPEADELATAAMVRGGPVPMRPAATVDLQVPAETEIVVEGRILPGERRPEAPFGEFMGYYVPEGQNHVFEITGVSARPSPIFHGLLCGSPEDLRPLETAIAARIYRHLVMCGRLPLGKG